MKQRMSFILFITLISGVTNIAYCSSDLDSLKRTILIAPDDTNKVLQLNELSYNYLKQNSDTSLVIIKKSFLISKKLNYAVGYASALNQLGLTYKYQSRYDSALIYYKKSLALFDSLKNDYEKAKVLNRLGNVYKRFGDFDLSIECFMNSIKIYQTLQDSIQMLGVINNLGVLYYDMKEFDKSLEYYMLYLNIANILYPKVDLQIVYMNIANIYNRKEDYKQATKFYKLSLEFLNNSNNKYDRLFLLHNLGRVYEESGKLNDAQKYYLQAISLEKEINEKELQVYSQQGIGNVLIKQGQNNSGIKYLENAYQLAIEIGDIRKEHKLARNLFEAYEKEEKYKESFYYSKKYIEIEDSIFSLDKKVQLINLEKKYQAEKREQQIAFLEKEKAIQKLELTKKEIVSKQRSSQRNAFIIIAILSISLLTYYIIDNKKRKKLNSILLKQNKKITEQRSEIEVQNVELLESNKTKDKLFQIIAHDLRSPLVSIDSMSQLIPYWIEEQDYDSLMRLSKTLELSVKNVLSLIDNLLSWALSQQGKFPFQPENFDLRENILETIHVYQPIAQAKNINLVIHVSKKINVFADRNMLFTVMRNLINNAVKFTPEKGKIEVGVETNQQFAKIWVKDSGIGVPEDKKQAVFEIANGSRGTRGETGKGLGLFFCKEFVQMNNGEIFIESGSGKGTTITFTLPLFYAAEN